MGILAVLVVVVVVVVILVFVLGLDPVTGYNCGLPPEFAIGTQISS